MAWTALRPTHFPWFDYSRHSFSLGLKAGDLLFLSGQAALDPQTERVVHEGDVVAQADYTYRNILRVVEAAGGGPESLVNPIEYTTPAAPARYREVAGVRSRLRREPYPVSTGPVCEALLRPGDADRDRLLRHPVNGAPVTSWRC
jgi:enamine deaminase RidA (YjgF/YER057c/UK114 family)